MLCGMVCMRRYRSTCSLGAKCYRQAILSWPNDALISAGLPTRFASIRWCALPSQSFALTSWVAVRYCQIVREGFKTHRDYKFFRRQTWLRCEIWTKLGSSRPQIIKPDLTWPFPGQIRIGEFNVWAWLKSWIFTNGKDESKFQSS